MGILNVIMQVALIFVSLLLICVILLQRNKGAGAGVSFGMGEAVFGADMGNVLTRTTIVLGIIFLVLVLGLSLLPYNKSANVSVMAGEGTPAPAQVAEPVLPAADTALPDEAAAAAEAVAGAADAAAAEEVVPAAAPAAPAEAPAAAPAAPAEAPAAAPAAPAEAPAK